MKTSLAELIEKLSSPSAPIRYTAASKRGKLGEMAAVDHLMDALDDEDYRVRDNVAFALGELGALKASKRLAKILKSDPNERVRKSAAKALGLIQAADAVPALIAALKDTDFRVRKSAARSLGKIGDARAVPALKEALNDPDYNVTKYVEDALDRITGL